MTMQLPFDARHVDDRADSASISVLHCIPTLSIGGAETQLKLLAPRLAARGVEVGIFGRLADGDIDTLTARGVTCFPLRTKGSYNPAVIGALLRAVRRARPTTIQTWLPQMDIIGGSVARALGVPWIISERSSPPAYPPSFKNSLRHWVGRRAAICANTEHGLAVWPRNADKSVIANGIDLAAQAARQRHNPGSDVHAERDVVKIVTVSRLVPDKCVDVLITALGLARAVVPDIALIIIGDGPDRNRLENMVTDCGLSDHVIFTGFLASPSDIVSSADMFASASLYEGHPNAVTEAAAAGIPAILSDIAMHRSLLGDGACYAPINDAASFARLFVALAGDQGRRAVIGEAGRQAVSRFDIDVIASQYIELYRRLARAQTTQG